MIEPLRYYKDYFIEYWEIKYHHLKDEIDNYKSRKNLLDIPNFKQKYLSMLKFDIHFIKFQLIETLFNFIFALENGDDEDIFFQLAFPKEKSQRSFAAYDKISGLNDKIKMEQYLKNEIQENGDSIPFWQYLFFFKIISSEINENLELIEKNIILLLNQLSSSFNDRDDYSSYKHSLRCYIASLALKIRPEGSDVFFPIAMAKDGMIYLTKTKKDGDTRIYRTFKAFSIEEDSYYIEWAIKLLKNIINSRKSYFLNEELTEINYFTDISGNYPDYNLIKFSSSSVSVNSLFSQAFQASSGGGCNEAIPIYEKILRLDASHSETLFQLGHCYLVTEKLDNAIKNFKLYVKNNVATHLKAGFYNLALCYYKKKDLEKSEKMLIQCLKKIPEGKIELATAARFLLAEVYLELNESYFKKNKKNKSNYVKKVEKLLWKTEETEFKFPEIWFKLAFIKDCLNKKNQSKEIYEKIISYGSQSTGAFINLSKIYYSNDQIEKMEELIKKALEINDKHCNTWIAYAAVKEKQGKNEEFYNAVNKALDCSKTDEEQKMVFNAFGHFYFKIKNFDEAFKNFENSHNIDPAFDQPFVGMIRSLWALEKFTEIIELTNDLPIDATQFLDFYQNQETQDILGILYRDSIFSINLVILPYKFSHMCKIPDTNLLEIETYHPLLVLDEQVKSLVVA